jgi:phenylpropionate dioxygenase-like ring-hydroxylating dioxygenase large terminal subunit
VAGYVGAVGLMDHECPHRCASLFYGRNEQGGLRCIYHGWKFDVTGQCLDMPNVPPPYQFKDKVRATAYQVAERNGVVWAYMGPGAAPALPAILANFYPEDEVDIGGFLRHCNWLQALEGDIDTSHAGFLHGGMNGPAHGNGLNRAAGEAADDPRRYDPLRYGYTDQPYLFEGSATDWGAMYGAYRPIDDATHYWRLAQFIFPFWTITPTSPIQERAALRAWVPLDDTHVRVFAISVKGRGRPPSRGATDDKFLPDTTGWYGRDRLIQSAENDYLIDRDRQRADTYSGIEGITQQDHAVTESMGPIANRTKEHLTISDRMIMVTRRHLIDAAIRLRDTGEVPATVTRPEIYAEVTGGYFLAPKGQTLATAYGEQQAGFLENTRAIRMAAE